jgi:tetratricopeptide (TPR) repeat protein
MISGRRWASVLVAATAVACAFPVIAGVFLFDDAPVVRDNPLTQIFSGALFGDDLLFRPLLVASLRLDRALFGAHALPMHAMNVALHALACVLLFHALLQLVDLRRALPAALLFAAHPVHLDAVAFIVNRSELLALIFLLLSFLALWRDSIWAASLAFGAALLCKETAAGALPVLLLALAFQLRPSLPRALLGFALTFAGYLVWRRLALGALTGGVAQSAIPDRGLATLLPIISRVYADYVRLMVAPHPLLVDRSGFVLGAPAWASYALHAAVFTSAFLLRRKTAVVFCILAFYAALLPVSHLLPFREIEAERFLYFPSVFACGLAACFRPTRALFLLVPLYGLVTLSEATHFRSAEALWSTMVERDPANPRAQYNLGTALFESGRCDLALPHLETAVRLVPGYALAYVNLGVCRAAAGDDAGAGEAFTTAVRLDGANPRALHDLAAWRAQHPLQ